MKTIIVTGMGRSGSTFLANLADQSVDATGRHEYFGDKFFQGLSYYSPDHPHLTAQLAERASQMQQTGVRLFVDVDPFVRYGLTAIRSALPKAMLFHLVRNGRRVIFSMYQRTSYTLREKRQPVLPLEEKEYMEWRHYSRFEKLCWYWADAVQMLLAAQLPVLRLEDITTDFSALQTNFLEPCGIDLPQSEWEAQRHRRINTNRIQIKHLFRGKPPKLIWDAQAEQQFQKICGSAMSALGYE